MLPPALMGVATRSIAIEGGSMPGIGLLHKWLRDACPSIHKARLSALVKVVHVLLVGGRLTLTDLGRRLPTSAFVKHNIKFVDRLLGNTQLQVRSVSLKLQPNNLWGRGS